MAGTLECKKENQKTGPTGRRFGSLRRKERMSFGDEYGGQPLAESLRAVGASQPQPQKKSWARPMTPTNEGGRHEDPTATAKGKKSQV